MSADAAVCFGFAEVGCITMYGKNHVTLFIGKDGIRLGDCLVK